VAINGTVSCMEGLFNYCSVTGRRKCMLTSAMALLALINALPQI